MTTRVRSVLFALLATVMLSERPAPAQCGTSISGRFGGEITAVTQLNATNTPVAPGGGGEIYPRETPPPRAFYSPRRKTPLSAPAVKLAMTQGASRAFVLLQNG